MNWNDASRREQKVSLKEFEKVKQQRDDLLEVCEAASQAISLSSVNTHWGYEKLSIAKDKLDIEIAKAKGEENE
jgi:hypothetical protein